MNNEGFLDKIDKMTIIKQVDILDKYKYACLNRTGILTIPNVKATVNQ